MALDNVSDLRANVNVKVIPLSCFLQSEIGVNDRPRELERISKAPRKESDSEVWLQRSSEI